MSFISFVIALIITLILGGIGTLSLILVFILSCAFSSLTGFQLFTMWLVLLFVFRGR